MDDLGELDGFYYALLVNAKGAGVAEPLRRTPVVPELARRLAEHGLDVSQ